MLTGDMMMRRLMRAALASGAAALAVNLAIVLGARHLLGVPMELLAPGDSAPRALEVTNMIPESFVVSAFAGAVLYGLSRFLNNPWPAFIAFVVLVTAAWTVGPFKHGAGAAAKIALAATHFVIALCIIAFNLLFLNRGSGR